jgi:SAM-dependent methyltransferase
MSAANETASRPAPIGKDTARDWIARWDAQQQDRLPDREDRFTALIDAVEAGVGRDDPLILDIGCGPGSLAARLLARLPDATVVAIDADPLTLALGRAAWPELTGLRFADADLREPGWSAGLGLTRPADAAVSTTALHWLSQPVLAAVYAEVGAVLRPGGLLLNGDHLAEDELAPRLAMLDRALVDAEIRRRQPGGVTESWDQWWSAVGAEPDLAALDAQRKARDVSAEHHSSPAGRLSVHVEALRAAGFAEVGTLWQRGDNRLLCGVKGG